MLVPTENGNGPDVAPESEPAGPKNGALQLKATPPVNGPHAVNRLLPALISPPAPKREEPAPDDRPILAVFSYDEPDGDTSRFIANLAGPLAARGVAVHVFARRGIEPDAAGATVHVLGEDEEGGLLDRVQEFTHRACNAFLRRFQGCSAPITLMGCEWSAVQAMSILRGIKDLNTILSIQSLERQRSDMTGELSQAIEAIELAGLREARTVLVHQAATAEVARYWVPECADRTVSLRSVFPAARFSRTLDPGAIKARYQVGPIDPMILFVGDLDPRYGPDLLIKSMPAVLKNHPQARLVIVGDGGEYWPLRVYTRYLLLEHAVRLPGSVEGDALDELIQAADVIAVPSRESTPWWTILAGWAAKRPVVASHDAAPGLLEHEKDAVLCYASVPSCVWGIERALFGADLCQAMAVNGTRKLAEHFGWGGVAAQVEELMAARAAR
jgi:glycosyltransferase involved in cell wall biosynthesis